MELDSLTDEDFRTILTQPKNALIEQYRALLATEGVVLDFTGDAIAQLATYAMQVNEQSENIGAGAAYGFGAPLEDVRFCRAGKLRRGNDRRGVRPRSLGRNRRERGSIGLHPVRPGAFRVGVR